MLTGKRYLTAKQAAEALGVNVMTLYAYVSRGLIRSETAEGRRRERRYNAEDVQRLIEHKEGRTNPGKAVREALHWGAPILESSLTLIADNSLYYRGEDAAKLAQDRAIEEVAALLWTGDMEAARVLFSGYPSFEKYLRQVESLGDNLEFMQRLNIALTLASRDDFRAYDLSPQGAAQVGAYILRLMTAILAVQPPPAQNISETLIVGWNPIEARAAPLINTALVLCADHELNASSFAARVAASTEAGLYAVVMAGLAALGGAKHGGSALRAEALVREISEPDQAARVIRERLQRGERIPGFGHKLYAEGDPRARCLLRAMRAFYGNVHSLLVAEAVADVVKALVGRAPNIDFALGVLAHTMHLPRGASLALFALGRTVGWIGHAIEQYASGSMIRPRARYIGIPPRA